jgi:paraquat-inducible protein B
MAPAGARFIVMNAADKPKVTRAPTLPLVWIVPLIALAVGGWMVFRELRNRGPEITIDFADGAGIEADKTALVHKGVSVGLVKAVELKPDMTGVKVRLRLDRTAAALAREGAQFWVVHPEIGLSGVRGLDTLLTGPRINVRPGKGPPAERFAGLETAPAPEIAEQGRTFILQSDRLGSLGAGSPVFYREVKVGAVETSRLADDAASVLVRIHVDLPYVDLIRTNTRFWNAGGFSFKVGLLGAELKNTSLESLITGGVAFATPDGAAFASPAPDGMVFKLIAEPDKDWLKWEPKIAVKSPAPSSAPPGNAGVLPVFVKP